MIAVANLLPRFLRKPTPAPTEDAPDLDANVVAFDSLPSWMTR